MTLRLSRETNIPVTRAAENFKEVVLVSLFFYVTKVTLKYAVAGLVLWGGLTLISESKEN